MMTYSQITVCYFSVAVLGRVDEKCAFADSTDDITVVQPSLDQAQCLNAADVPVQEVQHTELNSKLDSQNSEEKLQG